MSVLLCLLSDQHVPNLLFVHHYRPDHLVLIESEGMRRRSAARNLLAALKKGGLDYNTRCRVQPLTSEDDLAQVRLALQEAHAHAPTGEWIANVTGGTKPMSIATYEFFSGGRGRTVYTNYGQPDRVTDLVTGLSETCRHRLSIDEFVTGYGFRPQKPLTDLQEAGERARRPLWRLTANHLAAAPATCHVLDLDDERRKRVRDKGDELPAHCFRFPSHDLADAWLANAPSRKLDKYEGEFLTGGWLEVFFFNLLSDHADQLGIWDVTLGHNITHDDGSNTVPNDIDVSFMHNHGMAMVECKSGAQNHDLSRGLDTLYKIEAVARQLRALRVRSFLATTGENVLDKQGNVRGSLQSRAELYNCRILPRDQIAELAAIVLKGSPDTADNARALFRL